MKTLNRLKINHLKHVEMDDRAKNMIRGGNTCGCACKNNSKEENYIANWNGNKHSPRDNKICSWPGSGDVTVYGGSKAPRMP